MPRTASVAVPYLLSVAIRGMHAGGGGGELSEWAQRQESADKRSGQTNDRIRPKYIRTQEVQHLTLTNLLISVLLIRQKNNL